MKTNRVPIDDVKIDPANLRQHDDRQIELIASSLGKWKQQKPIVVDADGVVIAGHGVLAAARKLGWSHVDVVKSGLSGTDRVLYAIADNRLAELSKWDNVALAEVLAGIDAADLDMLGFTAEDMTAITAPPANEGLIDPDDAPAPPDEATTKPGDLWVLGNHRLLCGDSGSVKDLDRLLDGEKVHLANTDPPYNVKVEPRSNNAIAAGLSSFSASQRKDASAGDQQSADLHRYPEKSKPTHKKLRAKDRPLANDFVSDEAFDRMLDAWFGNIARVLVPGGGFYIWGGYANCGNYPPVLKKHELYFSQAVIWIKEHPVLTRKDFMGNHEWCFYGWKEGAAHRFFGPANIPDTWSVKKVNPNAMVHLTEKPVELAKRAIEYSSKPGENVLDLFGGSGSTLIACEQTGRRAFLMELDPLYCDVILARWSAFTSKQPVLERTGETFESLKKAERNVA